MPITSNPDAFYLSEEEFSDRFGFEKPRAVVNGREGRGGQGDPGKGSATRSRFSRSESPFSGKAKENEARSGLNAEDGDGVVDGADGGSGGEGAGYGKGGGEREEEGKGVEEVIFYCKAGVRSRAAARMAREWVGIKAGDMQGGWVEWESKGGEVER